MGDTWITDLTHYLDALDPSLDVPDSARRIATFFGNIASAATAMGMQVGDIRFPVLPCRRRPGRKPCPGYLLLGMQAEPPAIDWCCVLCGDKGLVYNFAGTPWDLSPAMKTVPDSRMVRVMIPEADFLALRDFSLFDRDAERAVKGAEFDPDDDVVVLSAPEAVLEELAGELASALNEPRRPRKAAALDRVYARVEEALGYQPPDDKIIHLFR